MLKYREFLDLTDDEIKQILTDMFNPSKIENIHRDEKWNEITAEITTGGWYDCEEEFSCTDEITLKLPTEFESGLSVDFSLKVSDLLKWRQFLLAKGCNRLLKDNPYLEGEIK